MLLHRIAAASVALLILSLGLAAPPAGQSIPGPGAAKGGAASALGIPCLPGPGGVRLCSGSIATLVPTWDGIPLDVDITLPPAGQAGPYPLIVGLHGFGTNKITGFDGDSGGGQIEWSREGYATMAYSARGIGFSCGLAAVRALPECAGGWIKLVDARYEIRDTQHLAGLLADEGLVKPRRIGVTGASYGGGQSLLLATLRDRVMMPDGELVPWRSPEGKPMRIAAAAPRIGWSDLAYALVPNGRKLDYRARNPYGRKVGVVKQSYLEGLYAAGLTGYYAPAGADPEADIQNWKRELTAGEPYDRAFADHVLGLFARYHSSYSVQDYIPRSERVPPAPTVIYNSWLDDIMPPDQALTYYSKVKRQFPGARLGLIFDPDFAHPRGSLTTASQLANSEREVLFDRFLMGDRSAEPLEGAITKTQGCDGAPELGPFRTSTWRAQHPGEVRARSHGRQLFTSAGGDVANSAQTDPFAGEACRSVAAATDPGAATYETAPAEGEGFTLIGSPTIRARMRVRGRYPEVVGRLWDVAPGGQQTLVTHGIYRPHRSGRQVFQIHPAGYHFAPAHTAKLELLGRDSPYARASNGTFEIRVRRLRLELPMRQGPDGGQVKAFRPPRPR